MIKKLNRHLDRLLNKLSKTEVPDWVENIVEFPDTVKYFIRHLYGWIIKSIQYSIFLWKDGDYDYHYIYQLLRFKIQRTRDHLCEHNMMVEKDLNKRLKQMDTAIELLGQLLDSNFCEEEYRWLEKKWGKHVFRKASDYGYISTRSKVKTQQDKKEESKDILRVARLDIQRQNQCRRKFFTFLEKNIEFWWD